MVIWSEDFLVNQERNVVMRWNIFFSHRISSQRPFSTRESTGKWFAACYFHNGGNGEQGPDLGESPPLRRELLTGSAPWCVEIHQPHLLLTLLLHHLVKRLQRHHRHRRLHCILQEQWHGLLALPDLAKFIRKGSSCHGSFHGYNCLCWKIASIRNSPAQSLFSRVRRNNEGQNTESQNRTMYLLYG